VTEVPAEGPAREAAADEPNLEDAHASHFSGASLVTAISSTSIPESIIGFGEFGGHFQTAVHTTVQQGFPTDESSYVVFSSGDARTVGAQGSFGACSGDAEFGTLCDRGGLRIQFLVPSRATQLKFDYRYFAVDYPPYEDPFQVFMEAGGGTTRVVRATLSSEIPSKPCCSANLVWGPMRQAVIDVTAYRGQVIALRFQASDRTDQANPGGALVDNLGFVVPNLPPSITAPANISVATDPGACAATGVALGVATATDDDQATVTVGTPVRSDGAAPDAAYPLGATTVTWTATDAGELTASANQTVTVFDDQAPAITAPADITVSTDAGQPHASYSPQPATATDNCPGVTVENPPAMNFPMGTTTLTYTATDASGLMSTANWSITVVDDEPPVLTIPPSFAVNATTPSGAVVSFSYSATDNGGPASVTCSRASGSTFAIGQTTVTCTATDGSGNTTPGSFTVTVVGARAQLEDLIARVVALALQNGTSQPLLNMLGTALRDPGSNSPDVACIKLSDFVFKMQDHKAVASISQYNIDTMIADAKQIQAVLGCS
jgi:hypothetical protein